MDNFFRGKQKIRIEMDFGLCGKLTLTLCFVTTEHSKCLMLN